MIYSHYSTTVHDLDLPGRADIFPILHDLHDLYYLYDLYDLYDIAHVAGWDPYSLLHDLAHISWVGSVLYRCPCTASHNGRLGYR